MTTHEVAIRQKQDLAPFQEEADQFSTALMITPHYVEQTKQSIALLQNMVKDVLVEGRDYGEVPGVPDEFLWEPGANQIVAAFNCHVGPPRVLNQVCNDQMISVILDVPLISFQGDKEVCNCVGAASTSEVKHKYRWVKKQELADWGYSSEESIKALKSKRDNWGNVKYRIPNPEPAELLNTVWKIAFKRGFVGAAQKLPGVSSALRETFGKKRGPDNEHKSTTDWDVFWADMKKMGLSAEQVHELAGVSSMKDWVKAGKTLVDARSHIIRMLQAAQHQGQPANTAPKTAQPIVPISTPEQKPRMKPRTEWDKISPGQIPDYPTLEKVFCYLTGLPARRLYQELGISSRLDVGAITAWHAFLQVRDIFVPEGLPQ